MQEAYLNPVQEYIDKGVIYGIRISTRPDLIDDEKLIFLKSKKVVCIELGVQSAKDNVLELSKRGHTLDQVISAAKMIKREAFLWVIK